MAGTLCHPAPTTRRAEPATAAREGHEAVVVAGSAVQVGEAIGEGAASDERLELSTNEARDRSSLGFGGVEQARELVAHDAPQQHAAGRRARSTALDRTGGRWWGGTHLAVPRKDRSDRISAACVALSGVGRHPVRQAFATHRGPGRAAAEQSGWRLAAARSQQLLLPLNHPSKSLKNPIIPAFMSRREKSNIVQYGPPYWTAPFGFDHKGAIHCGPLLRDSTRLRARGFVTTAASTSSRYHRPAPHGGAYGAW